MVTFLLSLILHFHISSAHIISAIRSRNVSLRESISADRTYYIAAIEIDWDYAPNAINPFSGIPVDSDEQASVWTLSDIDRIGSIYRKAVYREYTDSTFTVQKERNSDWLHLGVMGPPIRGIVGERIKIIFYNNCTQNYSMHPHGVEYNELSEGAMYKKNGNKNYKKSVLDGGQRVLPQHKWVYIWDLRENSAGSDSEISSKFWFYHSHINEPKDTNSGLIGPIIITKPNFATSTENNLMPNDINREFVTLFSIFDENQSWYLRNNLKRFASWSDLFNYTDYTDSLFTQYIEQELNEFDYDDPDFQESNKMHSMNGFEWNALGQYMGNIKKGEIVRWYIGAMGAEVDIHTAHWHGNNIKANNFIYEDVVQLMPAYSTSVDMFADNVGTWFYHCHVNDHVEAGMIAAYTVLNETCIDCGGWILEQQQVINNNILTDVLTNNQTWIIVIICLLINWCAMASICLLYKYCNTPKSGRTGKGVNVYNDDLRQSMLSDDDLEMTRKTM